MADQYTRLRELFGYEPALQDDDGGDGWTDGDRRWWVRFAAMPSLVRALLAERDALQAKVEAMWQPIETAPMDGTRFLAWRRGQIAEALLTPRDDCEMWSFGGESAAVEFWPMVKPTHWMPLPAPPAIDAARAALAQPTGEKP